MQYRLRTSSRRFWQLATVEFEKSKPQMARNLAVKLIVINGRRLSRAVDFGTVKFRHCKEPEDMTSSEREMLLVSAAG